MNREKEIADIKISLENLLSKEMPGYEVHLFESEKQKERKESLEKRLPYSDQSSRINKSDAWIVWLSDENQVITDLQVYDFQLASGPYRKEKIIEYVEYTMGKIPYRDCGCVNSDWHEWKLVDIYFKFGWQYGFYNNEIMIKCLRRLSYINEFREEIQGHLRFLE